MTAQKTYTENVHVDAAEWERFGKLLEIDDIDEQEDEAAKYGAQADDSIPLVSVKFQDGAGMEAKLLSGQSNYWVELTLLTPDGRLLEAEPGFDLPQDMLIFITDGASYCARLVHDQQKGATP